jgi:hypothetical protein
MRRAVIVFIAVCCILAALLVGYGWGATVSRDTTRHENDALIKDYQMQQEIDHGRFQVICGRAPEACANIE